MGYIDLQRLYLSLDSGAKIMQEAAITKGLGIMRWLGSALAASVLMTSGCTTVVPVQTSFPSPVVEPLPVDVGVYYDRAFRRHKYRQEGDKWIVPIGPASVALFNRVFAAMFEQATPVGKRLGALEGSSELDALIVPSVEDYELLTPAESGSKFYQVSIEYGMRLYDADGELIANWPISGHGRSRYKFLAAHQSLAEATTIAMRDAAASMIINFRHRPWVKHWLSQVNGNQDADNVTSSRKAPSPG